MKKYKVYLITPNTGNGYKKMFNIEAYSLFSNEWYHTFSDGYGTVIATFPIAISVIILVD